MAKTKRIKSKNTKRKISEALQIIEAAGLPLGDLTPRRLEKMAMALMALGDIQPRTAWSECKDFETNAPLTTRKIIRYMNENFEEDIADSSYDDIRRKDLVRLVGMGLVIKSANKPGADTNDGTRGYGITPEFAELIRAFGTDYWDGLVADFEVDNEYIAQFEGQRDTAKIDVQLADDVTLKLDSGPHNRIQKSIVEEFLPRFGYEAKVLYIGDTSDKILHKFSEEMESLGLNVEDRGMLPDIVAFSEQKGWLYLIEAVHSANPFQPERCIELRRTVLKDCKHPVIFVTAFASKKDFKKWALEIAWETEVWVSEAPDHLIHFNGDKFLGPHSNPPELD